jgi:Co/Zn/Cd efflux system component
MSATCDTPADDLHAPGYRRVLWIVLGINAAMFVIEGASGLAAGSVSLQANALDFLGDAATYAVTLMVLGLSIRWRAGSAILKGLSMSAFGIWVLGSAVLHAVYAGLPDAAVMGGIGFAAMVANVVSAVMLYRHRHGDANMRSVWLCTRNDAIGNAAVIGAGLAVYAVHSGVPDLLVGVVMAGLALSSAWSVLRLTGREWRTANA